MADGQRLAESQDITFMETSARSNVNISEAFSTMARIILEKVRSGAEKRGREERSFLCLSGIVVHLFSVAMSYWCMYVCVYVCVFVCVCVCVCVHGRETGGCVLCCVQNPKMQQGAYLRPTSNDQGKKTSSEEDKAKCCTKT